MSMSKRMSASPSAERGNVEPSGIPLHSGDPSWDAFIRRGPKMYQILQRVDLGDVLSDVECAALSALIREHAILTARLESAASPPPAPRAAGAGDAFGQIAQLPDDWDSYGAKRPDPRAIESARRLLAALAFPPSIIPTTVGGIQLEWHRGGVEVELRVPPAGASEFYVDDDELAGSAPPSVAGVSEEAKRV